MKLLNLTKQIVGSEGTRQSSMTIVGNILATGISAIAIIIISRMLGPEDFGKFSVGFALILILNRINDAGLNAAIIRFAGQTTNQATQRNILGYAGKIKLAFSISLLIIGLLISPWLAKLLRFDDPTIIYLSFLFNFASSWYEHALITLQALHKFGYAIAFNFIQATTKLVGIGILVLLGSASTIPIFSWYMISPAVPLLFIASFLPKGINFFSTKYQLTDDKKQKILMMARHSALGFIAAGLIENVDILIVQGLMSDHDTGLLSATSRIAMMFTLIAYSLGNVLNPRVSRYKTKEHLSKYMAKARLVALASLFIYLLIIPLSRLIILLTVGPAYLEALPVLDLLLASAFMTIATIPFLAIFYSLEANWYFSVSGVGQLIIILIGNIVYVPSFGLMAVAWSRVLSKTFLLLFTVCLAYYVYHRNFIREKNT